MKTAQAEYTNSTIFIEICPVQTLRPYSPADCPQILEIYRPFIETSGITFETEVPSLEQFQQRLDDIAQAYPFLVIEEEGKIIAYAYACRHRERAAYRWIVETSVYVHHEHYHQGLGQKIYAKLFETLRERNFMWAFAGITLPNPSSMKLHLQFGFEPLALYEQAGWKLGEWHDVHWLKLALNPPTYPPVEPIFKKS